MIMNPADSQPITLSEIEKACLAAPFYRLMMEVTLRLADGKPPIQPDHTLGLVLRELWANTDTKTRQHFVEDALGAIRAASFDGEVAVVCAHDIVHFDRATRTNNVVAFVGPKGSVTQMADEPEPDPPTCIRCGDPCEPGSDYCDARCYINAENEGA